MVMDKECQAAFKEWHDRVGDQDCDWTWKHAWQARDKEVLSLHRQLAAEKLRADQGWARAESKSRECIELRERMAGA